jgi:NlpC/P60 family putative phage cell wall peptidase
LPERVAIKEVLTMTEQEQREREAVLAEAKEWIGTPYHVRGRIKGAGCDCGTFLLGVFENTGMIPKLEKLPFYAEDVACHCAEPRYLIKIQEYCNEIPVGNQKPGDILVFQFAGSKVPHHSSIVVDDEYMIHSYTRQGVILSNTRRYLPMMCGVYRSKRWAVD